MPRARENISLTSNDYDISGNAIRAYYDDSHKLIFVLDETINADKPNVLLVIDSFDGRKWDDVLANDYNVDLETVRPKRDNKYQKLDIEYGGLDVYSALIAAYKAGDDLSDEIANLTRFRMMSVRRSATERLAAAEETISKSQETIERTNETIAQLHARIKELRSRVSEQRRGIGREPTKASAAKILKSEAQLDATNEKLARAKKRLSSAQHRLTAAESDAEIAREILARDVPKISERKTRAIGRVSQPKLSKPESVPEITQDKEILLPEPKAEEMADEEVKPLFDKDPENLDDEMAFKPIDFGAVKNTPVADNHDDADDEIAPAPLSFVPPASEREIVDDEPNKTPSAPMLDSLTSVPEPNPVEPFVEEDSELPVVEEAPAPIAVEPVVAPVAPVAPVASVRPVSPITGTATPVSDHKSQKPTLMYYIMLILLILLSIGTLWLYQKTVGDNGSTPNLMATATETTVVEPSVTTEKVVDKKEVVAPVVAEPNIVKPVVVETPASVVAAEPEPVPVSVVKPEPIIFEPEPTVMEPEPIVAEPEPVAVFTEPPVVVTEPEEIIVESPFITLEPAATYEPEPVRIPTEEEIMASKPGYNVSQNDKMFVASPDYDTEIVYAEEPEPVESVCDGGAAPDSLGCCPGETYTYTDDGFMCCNGTECFPPAE